MSAQEITILKSVDLCDLSCPHLLITVIRSLEEIEPGQTLQIRATDLNAPSSIASWSRQSNNHLHDMYEENGCFVFLLQRGEQNNHRLVNHKNIEQLGKEG